MIRITMDFYEKSILGAYIGDSHSYEFDFGAGHNSMLKFHDIICQAAEIEGFITGDYLLVIKCQEDDISLGKMSFVLHINNIERIGTPSRYFKNNVNPPIMSINRDTFKYSIESNAPCI